MNLEKEKEILKICREVVTVLDSANAILADGSSKNNKASLDFKKYSLYQKCYDAALRYLECDREIYEWESYPSESTEDSLMIKKYITSLQKEKDALSKDIYRVFAEKNQEKGIQSIIVEFRAATGGTEAALFAYDLMKMYMRFFANKGWKCDILSVSRSSLQGIKEAIVSVDGDESYLLLRFENGVHRVQRVPETESMGRVHTSTATVAILPQLNDTNANFEIPSSDIRIETMRASGAGGQHVNKTDSAVRITHIPTGITAFSAEKSQHANRNKAMKILQARVYEKKRLEENATLDKERRLQIGLGDRSEKIRTYNFAQNRVTDHRMGVTVYNLESILYEDALGLFIEQIVKKAEKKLT